MRLHELAEGNDDTEIHVEIEHVVDSAGDRKAQLQSCALDRAGLESATTRSPLVGPGDDQRDLESGRDERSQRPDGHVGSAEEREPPRMGGRIEAHDSRLMTRHSP